MQLQPRHFGWGCKSEARAAQTGLPASRPCRGHRPLTVHARGAVALSAPLNPAASGGLARAGHVPQRQSRRRAPPGAPPSSRAASLCRGARIFTFIPLPCRRGTRKGPHRAAVIHGQRLARVARGLRGARRQARHDPAQARGVPSGRVSPHPSANLCADDEKPGLIVKRRSVTWHRQRK